MTEETPKTKLELLNSIPGWLYMGVILLLLGGSVSSVIPSLNTSSEPPVDLQAEIVRALNDHERQSQEAAKEEDIEDRLIQVELDVATLSSRQDSGFQSIARGLGNIQEDISRYHSGN